MFRILICLNNKNIKFNLYIHIYFFYIKYALLASYKLFCNAECILIASIQNYATSIHIKLLTLHKHDIEIYGLNQFNIDFYGGRKIGFYFRSGEFLQVILQYCLLLAKNLNTFI